MTTSTHTHSTRTDALVSGDVVLSPSGETFAVETVIPLTGSAGRSALTFTSERTNKTWTQNVRDNGTYAVMCSLPLPHA